MPDYRSRIQGLVDKRDSFDAQVAILGQEWIAAECPYRRGQTVRVPPYVGSNDEGCIVAVDRVGVAYQREEQRWYWTVTGRITNDGRKSKGGFKIAVDRTEPAKQEQLDLGVTSRRAS